MNLHLLSLSNERIDSIGWFCIFLYFFQMQTRTLYSIIFFKGVISNLARYYQAWFPLITLQSCKVMGDFRYRHVMLYVYATKSVYVHYNLRCEETDSSMNNSFLIKYTAENDEERVITDNIFLQRISILPVNNRWCNIWAPFSFSLIFQFDFLIERRSFLLIFQHIIDQLDNDMFDHQDTPASLTIHIYLNRPPYDSILDLGIVERNVRRLWYHFLPLSIYELFEIFTVEIHLLVLECITLPG